VLLGVVLGCGRDQEGTRTESEEQIRPNVVLISLDTFRADRLGQAPFISELAAKGWMSTRVWSSSNWTLPSHMSLLTSSNPVEHDRPRAGVPYPPIGESVSASQATLAEAFRAAGYFTAASTDGGFLAAGFDFERGFDRFVWERMGDPGDSFERHRLEVDQFIEEREGGQPFFFFIHSYEIHDYFLNTPPYHHFVDEEADREYIEHGSWLDEIQKGTAPPGYVSRLYDSGVRWTDSFVRQLVSDIEAKTPGENLLVVITSDHGESFGAKPELWHHGRGLWEEQLRVPLVAWGNYESSPRGRNDAAVSLIDVAPSILGLSGIEAPTSFSGRSDVFETSTRPGPVLREGVPRTVQASRVHTGATWGQSHISQALIESGWKYYRLDSFDGKTKSEHCYDLSTDPAEMDDRMGDPSSPCGKLARAWATKLQDSSAQALYVVAYSEAPVVLRLADSESVVGVRTALGSDSAIGAPGEGSFRWTPRALGDRLMILLRREPKGKIEVLLDGEVASAGLLWSELGFEEAPIEVQGGRHRARLFRRNTRTETTAGGSRDEEALYEQLKALGYTE